MVTRFKSACFQGFWLLILFVQNKNAMSDAFCLKRFQFLQLILADNIFFEVEEYSLTKVETQLFNNVY